MLQNLHCFPGFNMFIAWFQERSWSIVFISCDVFYSRARKLVGLLPPCSAIVHVGLLLVISQTFDRIYSSHMKVIFFKKYTFELGTKFYLTDEHSVFNSPLVLAKHLCL